MALRMRALLFLILIISPSGGRNPFHSNLIQMGVKYVQIPLCYTYLEMTETSFDDENQQI